VREEQDGRLHEEFRKVRENIEYGGCHLSGNRLGAGTEIEQSR